MNTKKAAAVLCVVAGIVLLAVPVFFYFNGRAHTEALLASFEQGVDHEEEEETDKEQTEADQEEDALLLQGDVIGIIEIPALGIRYPVVEGAGSAQLSYAIGHLSDTAGIGEVGNCVLCGHNGSRNGEFFTNLATVPVGTEVLLTDKTGTVHTYEIAETKVVRPTDTGIKAQDDIEVLTLFTCAQKGTKRYVCVCQPREG